VKTARRAGAVADGGRGAELPSVIRLAVRCRADQAETVLADLLELAPGGVEEERDGEIVEYAIYGAPGEVPELGALEAAAGDGLVEVRTEEIPDDWADRWRDFHEPTVVADGRLVVRPSWTTPKPAGSSASRPGAAGLPPSVKPGASSASRPGAAGLPPCVDVLIDPGQAFGTGAHATTRMCLELLVESADAGEARGSLADLGTGSGVLAIAAAKLGFAPVVACDHEPAALDAADANARANGVEIACMRVNLREQAPPTAETVVANLTAPLLLGVAERLDPASRPRALICSGLLEREADGVAAAFGKAGLVESQRRVAGEWTALALGAG
jgi:ribosomal protein L11 methyltransferase